jgi:hypothetical protein
MSPQRGLDFPAAQRSEGDIHVGTLTDRHRGKEADLSKEYIQALIAAREEAEGIVGQGVDLGLDNERVRNYTARLLGHDTLFNGNKPLVLLDVHPGSASESPLRGAVVLDENGATFERYSWDQLRSVTKELFKTEKIGITSCDVVKLAKPPYFKCWATITPLPKMLQYVEDVPEEVVQRVVVISVPKARLPRARWVYFANFFSELAGMASRVKRDSTSGAYSIGHLLKDRLGTLKAQFEWISQDYYGQQDITARICAYQSLVEHVYSLAEMVHLFHFLGVEDVATTLGRKKQGGFRFSTEDVLNDLTEMILSVAAQCPRYANKQISLQPPPSFKASIKPVLPIGADRTVRLKDEFYREILFEVCTNTLEYGIGQNGWVSVAVERASIESLDAIVLSNAASHDTFQGPLREPQSDWLPWSSGSPTGLQVVSDLLRRTEAGRLFYRHPLQAGGNQRCFSVALAFRGLALSSAADNGGEAYGQDSDSLD